MSNATVNASYHSPSGNATSDSLPPLDAYFIVYASLFVFGLICNLLTLMTLSHSSLRGWSTQVLLAALSLVDSIALFMTFLLVLQEYKLATVTGAKSCKFFA